MSPRDQCLTNRRTAEIGSTGVVLVSLRAAMLCTVLSPAFRSSLYQWAGEEDSYSSCWLDLQRIAIVLQ